MFVGDKGKILAGFRGEEPHIIPARKCRLTPGRKRFRRRPGKKIEHLGHSIKNKEESPGSFLLAGPVTGNHQPRCRSVKGRKKGGL